MLERRLEPEVMDTPDEALDYDRMDHSAVNTAFAQDFLKVWSGQSPVLDLGTGTAQIPIAICGLDNSISLIAVDLSEEMLKLARANVAAAGLTGRIQLQKGDAKGLPFGDASMAAVISNSIIHHVPDPRHVFSDMLRVLKPGGTLFIRDLLRPADMSTLHVLVNLYAAGANDHQRQLFAESLHAALTLDEVKALVKSAGMNPEQVTQTSDRHWTWAVPKR